MSDYNWREEYSECVDTVEKSLARLLAVEAVLKDRFKLTGEPNQVRMSLLERYKAGTIVEDEIVSNWLFELSWYEELSK